MRKARPPYLTRCGDPSAKITTNMRKHRLSKALLNHPSLDVITCRLPIIIVPTYRCSGVHWGCRNGYAHFPSDSLSNPCNFVFPTVHYYVIKLAQPSEDTVLWRQVYLLWRPATMCFMRKRADSSNFHRMNIIDNKICGKYEASRVSQMRSRSLNKRLNTDNNLYGLGHKSSGCAEYWTGCLWLPST